MHRFFFKFVSILTMYLAVVQFKNICNRYKTLYVTKYVDAVQNNNKQYKTTTTKACSQWRMRSHFNTYNQTTTHISGRIVLDNIVHERIILATIVWKEINPQMIT